MAETRKLVEDLVFWLEYVSLFSHIGPWEITLEGQTAHTREGGLGYLSRTVIERGEKCVACGNCCRNMKWSPVVFWFGQQPHPEDVVSIKGEINGEPLWIHYHRSTTQGKDEKYACDYLDGNLCSLHEPGLKGFGCKFSPQIWHISRGNKTVLCRYLPPRNWRWPNCPVVMAEVKSSPEDDLTLVRALHEFANSLPPKVGASCLSGLGVLSSLLGNRKLFFKWSRNKALLLLSDVIEGRLETLEGELSRRDAREFQREIHGEFD